MREIGKLVKATSQGVVLAEVSCDAQDDAEHVRGCFERVAQVALNGQTVVTEIVPHLVPDPSEGETT